MAAEDPPVVAPDGQGRLQPQPHPGVPRAQRQGHRRQQQHDQATPRHLPNQRPGVLCPVSSLPGAGAGCQLAQPATEENVPGQNHNSFNVTSKELGQVDLCREHVACCVLQKCLHLTLPVTGWAKQVFV